MIDLYYQHRVDPTAPIEDTVGAMAELVMGRSVTLACRKPHPTRSNALKACIQSLRSRRNIHYGAETRKASYSIRCASLASAS